MSFDTDKLIIEIEHIRVFFFRVIFLLNYVVQKKIYSTCENSLKN